MMFKCTQHTSVLLVVHLYRCYQLLSRTGFVFDSYSRLQPLLGFSCGYINKYHTYLVYRFAATSALYLNGTLRFVCHTGLIHFPISNSSLYPYMHSFLFARKCLFYFLFDEILSLYLYSIGP